LRRFSPCFSRRWRPGSSLRRAGCAARLPGWLAAWGRGGPGGWPCAAALPST
jgi:hypothetical protein